MSLNEDILSLIFEELKNDKISLYSCLFVNRIWCVTAIPILWRNPNPSYNPSPSEFYYMAEFSRSLKILFNMILFHLSEESRNILKNQGINVDELITEKYERPLFNYINFWKYLNLSFIESMIYDREVERSKIPIIRNEILKSFINNDINLIHLSIIENLDYGLQHISGFENSFSKLESIHFNNFISDDIFEELAKICKSIKKLRFDIFSQYTSNGIIKLIEVQKNLNDVHLSNYIKNEMRPLLINLENSLIEHADTIQYLKINSRPTTLLNKFLTHFINLLRLEIMFIINDKLNIENLSLPNLKILKIKNVSFNTVINIIENTNGHLTEISLFYYDDDDDKKIKEIIETIYKNCSNLRYFKLSYDIGLIISELENLLINCKSLNGLVIDTFNNSDIDKLFEILTRSSPITLFKFEFYTFEIKLKDAKLFLNNWKDRNPMFLKLNNMGCNKKEIKQQLEDLAEEYKTKGIIKKYFIGCDESNTDEDFENFIIHI
jgi:hypothetical protein